MSWFLCCCLKMHLTFLRAGKDLTWTSLSIDSSACGGNCTFFFIWKCPFFKTKHSVVWKRKDGKQMKLRVSVTRQGRKKKTKARNNRSCLTAIWPSFFQNFGRFSKIMDDRLRAERWEKKRNFRKQWIYESFFHLETYCVLEIKSFTSQMRKKSQNVIKTFSKCAIIQDYEMSS